MKIISGGQTGADGAALDVAVERGKYLAHTRKNVADADATLAFTIGKLTGGTKTIEFAREYEKPYLHINLKKMFGERVVKKIVEWLNKMKPTVLKVAGSKKSSAPGIHEKVSEVLLEVLQKLQQRPRS